MAAKSLRKMTEKEFEAERDRLVLLLRSGEVSMKERHRLANWLVEAQRRGYSLSKFEEIETEWLM